MRFVWSEPPKESNISGTQYNFPKAHWREPVLGWLRYNGVWPEAGPEHLQMEYNYVWHFYDITLFEHRLSGGHGEPDRAIREMRAFLVKSKLKWQQTATFRWSDGEQIPGVRFWIDAER